MSYFKDAAALLCRRQGAALAASAIVFGADVWAQGTGSVASPVLRPGSSISFATGIALDEGEDGYAQRIDYMKTVSENWRVRSIVFFNDRGGAFRYRRLELEAMHQFASSQYGWNSALQVRGRLPDGNDGPERVRLAWLNRWRPKDGPELRAIGLASREFGNDRDEGLALESRFEATWRLPSGNRAGAQMFNRYNTTSELGSFDDQRHSIGGVLKGGFNEQTSYRLNALVGVSDAAADFELRFRLRFKL
ncbi:MAG: hypothetical protein AAFQ15_11705 [Pseudomonadota bacterium]